MGDTVLITVEIPEQLWEDALKFGIDMDEVAKDVSDFAVLYLISLISMSDNGCWKVGRKPAGGCLHEWEKTNKSRS
jgi:hypothetical protein